MSYGVCARAGPAAKPRAINAANAKRWMESDMRRLLLASTRSVRTILTRSTGNGLLVLRRRVFEVRRARVRRPPGAQSIDFTLARGLRCVGVVRQLDVDVRGEVLPRILARLL